MKKQKKWLKWIIACIGAVLLLVMVFAAYLTVTEYKPAEIEELEIIGEEGRRLSLSDEVTVVSYNIGYGCNSADADFFMDGGKMVRAESKEKVEENLDGILSVLDEIDADVMFLQEIDIDSKRAYNINEVEMMAQHFGGDASYAFAYNYYCKYVPYPFPDTLGKVESGLVTINEYEVSGAKRYNLPCSYSWPVRLGQLKRGLLVERVPIEGTDKEAIFINLHLEAYADGEKKMAQTKVLVDFILEEYEKGNYIIAGGDFNQYFPEMGIEERYPLVKTEYYKPETIDGDMLPSEWHWAADISVPTCRLLNEPYNKENKDTQFYVIDGYILSPNVAVEEIRTVDTDFEYSDHNPVYLRVSLK